MDKECAVHWQRVAELGCILGGGPAQLHHAYGGSMRDLGIHKGIGQKTSDWFVLPLSMRYHTGECGIHLLGVVEWERRYGTQVAHLDDVCRKLGYNVWIKAGIGREVEC